MIIYLPQAIVRHFRRHEWRRDAQWRRRGDHCLVLAAHMARLRMAEEQARREAARREAVNG